MADTATLIEEPGTDVAVQKEHGVYVPAPQEPSELMGALLQAVQNPDADPQRMDQMLTIYERIEDRKAKTAFDEALAQLQAELPEIGKHGEARDKDENRLYKYAKWDDINREIKPYLSKFGFSLSFRVEAHERGLQVTGVLARAGHREETSMVLGLESASKAMSPSQARGSASSYGKRYTAGALLNLILTDEADDDGASRLSGDTLTAQQQAHIRKLLADLEKEEAAFLTWMNNQCQCGTVMEEVPFEKYETLVATLTGLLQKAASNG